MLKEQDPFNNKTKDNPNLLLGQIMFCGRSFYKILTNNQEEKIATLKYSLYHKTNMLPKVGDFVEFEKATEEAYLITYILPRKSVLKRKLVGKSNKEQIIAVNIDYAFITISLDEQFSIKKIERIIPACIDANIEPVIVVTKLDLCSDLVSYQEKILQHFPHIKFIVTSIFNKESINDIKELLKDNKTGVFIGSSGVGKSSLTNLILGYQRQHTKTVSATKSKGRHTTTAQELFILKSGGYIIDTPGIREFSLWLDNEDSLLSSFVDIKELAIQCKFSNCTHTTEVGCAILQALNDGVLPKDRYESYIKLLSEEDEKHLIVSKKTREQRTSDRKNKDKALSKRVKSALKHKFKYHN